MAGEKGVGMGPLGAAIYVGAPLMQGVQKGLAAKEEGDGFWNTTMKIAKASAIPLAMSLAVGGAIIATRSTPGVLNAGLRQVGKLGGSTFLPKFAQNIASSVGAKQIMAGTLTETLITHAGTGAAVGLITGVGQAWEAREKGEKVTTTIKNMAKQGTKSAVSQAAFYTALFGGLSVISNAFSMDKLKNAFKAAKGTQAMNDLVTSQTATVRTGTAISKAAETHFRADATATVDAFRAFPGKVARAPGKIGRAVAAVPTTVGDKAKQLVGALTGAGKGG